MKIGTYSYKKNSKENFLKNRRNRRASRGISAAMSEDRFTVAKCRQACTAGGHPALQLN